MSRHENQEVCTLNVLKKLCAMAVKYIWHPIVSNVIATLFLSGVLMVFIGAVFGDSVDARTVKGLGDSVLKVGSAILGAGVFAAIMKSGQFIDLFQSHIFDVIYNPLPVKGRPSLMDKWRKLTESLLQEMLPATHCKASALLEHQFFNSNASYHFEDHNISYEIDINSSGVIRVKNTTETTIVLSPSASDPAFEYRLQVTDLGELPPPVVHALLLNNVDYLNNAGVVNNGGVLEVSIPLLNIAKVTASQDKVVKLERIVEWSQDIKTEPYIKTDIKRYIKGARVSVNAPKTCKVYFERFGLGDVPANFHTMVGAAERWTLAASDDLLLPGQGFIIMLQL